MTKKLSKIIFIDTEFTGEHAYTTLVSLGIITLEGDEFYVTLNDYDKNQVTEWLKNNVLKDIDETKSISSIQAYKKLNSFLKKYSENKNLYVVSCGLLQDYLLMIELFKYKNKDKYFDSLNCLPNYLKHYAAIDLNTLFRVCNINPNMNRLEFAGINHKIKRHNALDDAKVVRKCFLKIKDKPELKFFFKNLEID